MQYEELLMSNIDVLVWDSQAANDKLKLLCAMASNRGRTSTNTCTWICLRNKSSYSHKYKTFIQLLGLIRPHDKKYLIIVIHSQKQNNFARLTEKYFEKRNTSVLLWEYFGRTVRKHSVCRNDNSRIWKRLSTSIWIQVQV